MTAALSFFVLVGPLLLLLVPLPGGSIGARLFPAAWKRSRPLLPPGTVITDPFLVEALYEVDEMLPDSPPVCTPRPKPAPAPRIHSYSMGFYYLSDGSSVSRSQAAFRFTEEQKKVAEKMHLNDDDQFPNPR